MEAHLRKPSVAADLGRGRLVEQAATGKTWRPGRRVMRRIRLGAAGAARMC